MVDYRFVWLSIFSSGQIPTPGIAVGYSLRCKVSLRFTYFKLPFRGIFENYSINELLTLILPAYLIVFRRFTENYQRAVFQSCTHMRRHFSLIVTNKMLRNGSHQPVAIEQDRWQKKCSREGTLSMWQYDNAVMRQFQIKSSALTRVVTKGTTVKEVMEGKNR